MMIIPRWACDLEFGPDHDHDDFECSRILNDMDAEVPDDRFWEVDEFGQPVYGTD